jgi:hypothetical protein
VVEVEGCSMAKDEALVFDVEPFLVEWWKNGWDGMITNNVMIGKDIFYATSTAMTKSR